MWVPLIVNADVDNCIKNKKSLIVFRNCLNNTEWYYPQWVRSPHIPQINGLTLTYQWPGEHVYLKWCGAELQAFLHVLLKLVLDADFLLFGQCGHGERPDDRLLPHCTQTQRSASEWVTNLESEIYSAEFQYIPNGSWGMPLKIMRYVVRNRAPSAGRMWGPPRSPPVASSLPSGSSSTRSPSDTTSSPGSRAGRRIFGWGKKIKTLCRRTGSCFTCLKARPQLQLRHFSLTRES